MKRATTIAAALGIALGATFAATASHAHPYGQGPGWGMGGGPGWGQGPMMGYGPGAGRGPGCGGGFGGGPGFGPGAGAGPAAFTDGRLAALKSELQITPAQESAWSAYAEQAKLQVDAMQKWRTTMRGSVAISVPERFELRDQMHKQRLAQAEAMTQKVKDLYAALTPEQKLVADQRLGGFGAGMRGGPGWRR